PDPEGPSRATSSPSLTLRLTSFSASNEPNVFETFRTSIPIIVRSSTPRLSSRSASRAPARLAGKRPRKHPRSCTRCKESPRGEGLYSSVRGSSRKPHSRRRIHPCTWPCKELRRKEAPSGCWAALLAGMSASRWRQAPKLLLLHRGPGPALTGLLLGRQREQSRTLWRERFREQRR